MQKKYFKCSFCKAGNSYIVRFSEKGKWCRCCQAYNYFDSNNGTKIDNNFNNNINYIEIKINPLETIGNNVF